MTTKSQIHQHPLSRPILWRSRNLSRRSLWRRRITYTSAQKESIMQNKPNFCRFWAKNGYLEEKQTQFKPNQTQFKPNQAQFLVIFIFPILPVLSKAEGPIHPNQTKLQIRPIKDFAAYSGIIIMFISFFECLNDCFYPKNSNAPGRTRTCNLRIRSPQAKKHKRQ